MSEPLPCGHRGVVNSSGKVRCEVSCPDGPPPKPPRKVTRRFGGAR